MKAQLFESKSEKEIRLANGVQFFAEEGEEKEAFIARVTEVIERDYVDTLELSECNADSFKNKNTKQLQKARQTAIGVELRIMQEILVERGALEEHPSENGHLFNATLTDEDIPAEGSGQDVADAQPEEPKFQFLMVRLKERVVGLTGTPAPKFQFLMVRLKANVVKQFFNEFGISIPYGAIKRAGLHQYTTLISIFQFLMVRLKV